MDRKSGGPEPCTFLEWDSEFFGRKIARVHADRLDTRGADLVARWCEDRGVECVYLLADIDDGETVRTAEDHGYRLVDVRLTLGRTTPDELPPDGHVHGTVSMRAGGAEDADALIALVPGSFTQSRFYFDPNFSRAHCEALYARWITRALERPDSLLIVAETGDRQVGYLVLELDEPASLGRFALMGVADEARGLGVGGGLVDTGIRHCVDRRVQRLEIVTQARNVGSQSLYQKFGFRTQRAQLWYHKWFE